jgi:hypothetical protein
MESTAEVLKTVAAIVSAFQTAADTLDFIKERKEKKKRRKDKEVEELLEIKILHKSLLEVSKEARHTYALKDDALIPNRVERNAANTARVDINSSDPHMRLAMRLQYRRSKM